jgi:predicted nucleic acid-binding protein
MYLLDTNVISELRLVSAGKANKKLLLWSANIDTALEHKLTLVTRNIKDFNITGLAVLNPFE